MQRILNIYIDGANLYHAACELGFDLDYKLFRDWLREKYQPSGVYLFIGHVASNEKFYTYLKANGFILVFKETIMAGCDTKGNCDTELAIKVVSDFYTKACTEVIVISGDGDFSCLIRFLQEHHHPVSVLAPHRHKCSSLIRKTRVDMMPLNDHYHKFSKQNTQKAKRPPMQPQLQKEPLHGYGNSINPEEKKSNENTTFNSKKILYATSTVADGNMSMVHGDHAEVVRNREVFLKKSGGLLDDCVVMRLEHGDTVTRIGKSERGMGARAWGEGIVAEALMTNEPGVILFMVTADCLPISFYDPVHHAIALAHLGWRPTDLHLTHKVVHEMRKEFGTNPHDLRVAFGPSIKKESYIQEIVEQKSSPKWQLFLKDLPEGGTSINVVGYNLALLVHAGVLPQHVTINPADTAKDTNYFSHYRALRSGEKEGRFATILGLKKTDKTP